MKTFSVFLYLFFQTIYIEQYQSGTESAKAANTKSMQLQRSPKQMSPRKICFLGPKLLKHSIREMDG
jgi:hypothetical protein